MQVASKESDREKHADRQVDRTKETKKQRNKGTKEQRNKETKIREENIELVSNR